MKTWSLLTLKLALAWGRTERILCVTKSLVTVSQVGGSRGSVRIPQGEITLWYG